MVIFCCWNSTLNEKSVPLKKTSLPVLIPTSTRTSPRMFSNSFTLFRIISYLHVPQIHTTLPKIFPNSYPHLYLKREAKREKSQLPILPLLLCLQVSIILKTPSLNPYSLYRQFLKKWFTLSLLLHLSSIHSSITLIWLPPNPLYWNGFDTQVSKSDTFSSPFPSPILYSSA